MAESLSKWKHFESDIILLCVRWYLKYPLFFKKIVQPMMGFHSYKSACATLSGIEVMHMIHKGQAGTSDVISEIKLINQLFGVA